MLNLLALIAAGVLALPSVAAQYRPLAENVKLHPQFPTKHLASPRDIVVCLPPGYETDKERRYPTFYLHDGSNVYVEWKLDEVVKGLISAGKIEPIILVLVPNGGAPSDRFDDYTPTRPANAKAGGKADAYGRMIVEELKPFIDATYRTLPGRTTTALGGASLGGLVTMYFGLQYPDTFGKLAVISPSVWWDNKRILQQVRSLKARPATRIWLDVGSKEPANMIGGTRELRDTLVRKGWKIGADLSYLEVAGAAHNERAFATRAENILSFLFPAAAAGEQSK